MSQSKTETILSVVVGSRLHGLARPDSDWDIRGIFMHPLMDIVSPYRNPKSTSWVEGDEDNTAYELRDFCKYATQGNATILEILWSDQVRATSPIGQKLQENRHRFLDSKRIFEAHKGYAANQYKKMSLFEPDNRTPKFAVAYVRVLLQAMKMLETGSYDGWLEPKMQAYLYEIKNNPWEDAHIASLSKLFAELQVQLADVYAKNPNKLQPDIPWIEEFLLECYAGELTEGTFI